MRLSTAPSRLLLTTLSLLLLLAPASAPAAAQDGVVAFRNVNVVPMDDERVLENHTVIVRDGRIESVAPAGEVTVPEGATEIDGTGRYLMPGLAEMHGHVPGTNDPQYTEDVLFLYVSNGVTTVRGMAGHPSHLDLRERAERGEIIAPTLYAAAPGMSRNSAPDPEAADRLVRQHHDAGYDLLKVFDMSPETYQRMAESAREVGMPFAGHIPASVGLTGALEARQASIDHLDRYVEFFAGDGAEGRQGGFFGSGIIDLADAGLIPAAVEATREAGVWNVPTLSLVEHLAEPESPEEMRQRPELRYMPSAVVDRWIDAKREFDARDDFQPERARQLVQLRRDLTKALHDGGAMIALGSDAPQFFNVPGFSIHHEMRMMEAAGLTPYQVLVTGTRNPAIYFNTPDDFGTVAAGRRADLILLEANPLDNLEHVQERAGVMVRGRWLPESEIQSRLDAIAARNSR